MTQRSQRDFHDRKHWWKSFRVSVFIMSCHSVWISSVLSKPRPLSFNFVFGNRKKNHRDEVRWIGSVGCDCCLRRRQKLLHNERRVSRSALMMHGSGTVAPLVWTFAPDVFPQSPRTFATEFSIHHLSWWNKFLIHDAFNVKLLLHFRSSLANKVLVYKVILKPIWTYGVQLWGSAPNCNLGNLEWFQSKVLRIITDAPRYVPNAVIKRDLQVLSVWQEVRYCSVTYRQRLSDHPNSLAKSLFKRTHYNCRLKRHYPADLATRLELVHCNSPETITNRD